MNIYWRYPLVYESGLPPIITYISESKHRVSLSAVCLRTKKILNRLRAFIELRSIKTECIKIRPNSEIETLEVKDAIIFLEMLQSLEISEGGALPSNIKDSTILAILEALRKGYDSYLSSKIFFAADGLTLNVLSVPMKFIFLPDLGEGEYALSSESLRCLLGEAEFLEFACQYSPLKCRVRGFKNQFFLIDAFQSSLVFSYIEEACDKCGNSIAGLMSIYAVQILKKSLAIKQNNFYSDEEEYQLMDSV